jgi:hypothetical protein
MELTPGILDRVERDVQGHARLHSGITSCSVLATVEQVVRVNEEIVGHA